MRFLPRRLRGRLLLANLIVAGAAIGTVLVGVSLVGPGYFEDAMGHRPGDPAGQAMDELTLAAFRQATSAALLGATITATLAAVVVSLALATRVANPVSRLADAARRVAAGHYAERVTPEGAGEVAELATSFNQMSASLDATERRRLQLVGDVAHELRTPLSTLDGFLEGLEDGVVQPTAETWQVLRRETRRLTGLVDDLQELWRAEARELPLHLEAVDLGEVITEVAERFAPMAAERQIRITPAVGGAVAAQADRDRVVQIIANFLSNALRYSPEATVITVGAASVGDEARAWVRDAGPGLSPEQRTRVFERFYRLDPSRARSEGGSGIGLAIVRALAEAMDGHAWAESDGPGTGSTFWVALPTPLS
jgi:two-component system sensor histidine kinase BaeS